MNVKPLKIKILISFLIVIIVLSVLIASLGYYVIKKDIIDRAQAKVENDLDFAREVYRKETSKIEDVVRLTSLRFFVKDAILANDLEKLRLELNKIREVESLDVLTLTDKDGQVVVRARDLDVSGDSEVSDEIVNRVVENKKVFSATMIIPQHELAKEGLAEQAYIKFKPTPKAKATQEIDQSSGMMIKAAAPVFDDDNNLIGVLYGGNLLNRNYGIVDKVKNIVYQGTKYKGKCVGTVTIFQDDLRISTNVQEIDGERAIGTRVSEEVHDYVLEKGHPWVDSAFVVNDWYKTAYEPIRDIDDQIIGMLYVGTLERPFNDMSRNITLVFMLIIVIASLLAVLLSIFLATLISKPLTSIAKASVRLSMGELGTLVKARTNVGEVNELVESFNEMSQQLEERDRNLKLSNEMLANLNKRYIDLVSFVSHELKGIVATVVLNICAVRENIFGDINEKQKKALDGASRSLDYLTATIKKFLNLGKIEKGELEVKKAAVYIRKDVFDVTVNSLSATAARKNMIIENKIASDLKVNADHELMQIVASNLLLNAIKYGLENGNIVLRSEVSGNKIEIDVYNDSVPISQEQKSKLFKRFSRLVNPSVMHVKGTGLGLFITKEIIEKHGGKIWVMPRENGNSFIFQLAIK